MRYRKSVKICKGVKVNFSKSGTSLTVGGRGASVNFGKKGTYLNTSIPGTGLYNRQRIGGSSKSKTNQSTNQMAQKQNFKIIYHEDGSVGIIDSSGIPVMEQSLLRQIKNSNEYKVELERLSQLRLDDLNSQTEEFISIHKKSAKVYSVDSYKQKLKNFKIKKYKKKNFIKLQPVEGDVRNELLKEAEKNISTIKFWKKKTLIEEYVKEHQREALAIKMIEWKKEKDKFEYIENENEKRINTQFENDYYVEREHLEKLLSNDELEISRTIDSWLETVTFPFEFFLDYDIREKELLVDLDLPEIEDMPINYAQRMANGTVKIKKKTQKDTKEDYYKCVLGLALFFATHLLNCAIGIEMVIISAYTQRKDNKGITNDEYIYSIKFDRERLIDVKLNEDIGSVVFKYENICLPKADKTFKKIEPYA